MGRISMKKALSFLLTSIILVVISFQISNSNENKVMAENSVNDFIKGADISTLDQLESQGAKFYENGVEKDVMQILKDHGINYIRLRLWNDPYDMYGNPYGAGNTDLDTVISLAKRAQHLDMKFLLDFHYSDFWADPGKQNKPKAWENLTFNDLETELYNYTKDVMNQLTLEGVIPDMVQIGNELNSGMLWPDGKSWGEGGGEFDRLATLLKAGIDGVKDSNAGNNIEIMLHLADGGDNDVFRWWFDEITSRNVDFDVIGVSYYPYWHGSLNDLQYNLDNISQHYNKDVIVVETAYGQTIANGDALENAFTAVEEQIAGYPATVQGQKDYLRDLINVISNVPENKGAGMFYWEPAWIPIDGAGWATQSGMAYIDEYTVEGNEWENQALFDFNGNVLDSLNVFNEPIYYNQVKNYSFELDGATQTPSYWERWSKTGDYSPIKVEMPGYNSEFKLSHWSNIDYEVSSYQQLDSLENGFYTLSAWILNSGGQKNATMYAKKQDGTEWNVNLSTENEWTKVTIHNIEVTNGFLEVGFWSNAYAYNWINVDNVQLYQQN